MARHRSLPHRRARRPCRALRRLRPGPHRLQLLPQPPLSRSARARPAPQWLAARQAELLPVPYFHRGLHPAGAEAPRSPSRTRPWSTPSCSRRRPRRCARSPPIPSISGAEIGAVAVLHSWGQNLHHHPHIHCIVPGGGLSLDGTRWIACRPGFFLPVRVLSRLFRRLFLGELQAAHAAAGSASSAISPRWREPAAFAHRLSALRHQEWVVYAKPPFGGPAAGARLSRPLHPSRRDRQQPPRHDRGRTGRLPLARLSPSRQGEGHDARSRRVHPSLPAAQPYPTACTASATTASSPIASAPTSWHCAAACLPPRPPDRVAIPTRHRSQLHQLPSRPVLTAAVPWSGSVSCRTLHLAVPGAIPHDENHRFRTIAQLGTASRRRRLPCVLASTIAPPGAAASVKSASGTQPMPSPAAHSLNRDTIRRPPPLPSRASDQPSSPQSP